MPGTEQNSDGVIVHRKSGVATMEFNGPTPFNLMDGPTMKVFLETVCELSEDRGVRCIVLRGKGDTFCAGANLREFDGSGKDAPRLRHLASLLHDCITQLHYAPKPVLAGVTGVAAGGGFSLALSCDLVLMSEEARLEYAYCRVGLTGDGSSTFHLPRLVGLRKAKEIALLDEPIPAEKALGMDLVTEVVPREDFAERLQELGEQLAQGPTRAFGVTKQLFVESFERGLVSQMAEETDEIARIAHTEDFQRGHAAFLNKEKAHFTGE